MAQSGLLGKWLFGKRESQRAKKLEVLHSIGTKIVSSLDLDELLRRVVEAGVFITETEAGSLYLIDRETNILYEKAYKGSGEKSAKLSSAAVEEKIFRQIIDSKEPVIVNKHIGPVTGFFSKSILFVPLIARGRAIGLLGTYNLNPDREFTDEDKYFLSTVANYGAIAIDNAGFILETEQKVTKSLLTLANLKDVLQVIVGEARRVLEADVVNLYEYDTKHDKVSLPPVAAGKTFSPEIQAREGHYHRVAAFFRLLKRDGAFYASNAREDWIAEGLYDGELASIKGGFIDREGIVSSVGLPLIVDNERVGLLFINYRTYQLFTPDQKRRIEYFASQAALAIKIAKIITQAKGYLNQLAVLEKVSQDISSSVETGTEKLLNVIRDGAGKLLDLTNFYIACYDEQKNEVTFKLAIENGDEQPLDTVDWKPRTGGKGLTEYVIKSGVPLLVNRELEKWLQEKGVEKIGVMAKSWLGAPMISRNRVLGVIAIQDINNENTFDATHLHFLTTIASHAAIALDNYRLLNQEKIYAREIDNLQNLSSSILRGEDIKDILHQAAYAACLLIDGDYGMILLERVEEDNKLYLEGFYNKAKDSNISDEIIGYPVEIGVGITGTVAKEKKPLILDDVSLHSNYIKLIDGVNSEIAVPLLSEGGGGSSRVLGVLNVESNNKNSFSKNHLRLLERLASQVILAIDRTQRVIELERAQKHLQNSQRLAIIGLLYGEDLHLANNRLGAAQQYAKNIIEYAENLDKARSWSQKIEKNIGLVLEVISEMRTTVDPPKPVHVNIHDRINEILGDESIPTGINIKKEFIVSDPVIIGYERQLGHVFRVVIHNAIDAMEGEGTLTFITEDKIENGKEYIMVKVMDTGHGLSEDEKRRAFRLGSKKTKKGFGMGLAWSRLFLQTIGGDILLESAKGKGTTLSVIFPRDVNGIQEYFK